MFLHGFGLGLIPPVLPGFQSVFPLQRLDKKMMGIHKLNQQKWSKWSIPQDPWDERYIYLRLPQKKQPTVGKYAIHVSYGNLGCIYICIYISEAQQLRYWKNSSKKSMI